MRVTGRRGSRADVAPQNLIKICGVESLFFYSTRRGEVTAAPGPVSKLRKTLTEPRRPRKRALLERHLAQKLLLRLKPKPTSHLFNPQRTWAKRWGGAGAGKRGGPHLSHGMRILRLGKERGSGGDWVAESNQVRRRLAVVAGLPIRPQLAEQRGFASLDAD